MVKTVVLDIGAVAKPAGGVSEMAQTAWRESLAEESLPE